MTKDIMMNKIPKDVFDGLRHIEQSSKIIEFQFDWNVWTKNIHQYDSQFIPTPDHAESNQLQNYPDITA
jgi:hypothetical protein